MLKIKKEKYNSVCISADSNEELARTFLRFQEYYESPSKQFRNKIFTVGQVKHWYSQKYGADTYEKDWTGFNFPSRVLEPFKKGLFDPLTEEEKSLLSFFQYRYDNFYIIGANSKDVLRHELAHALYDSSIDYRNEINSFFKKNNKYLKKISQYIIKKGYSKEVLYDELQAYITDNDDDFIINNTQQHILETINLIYNKYSK
jgi:hypothetical protein